MVIEISFPRGGKKPPNHKPAKATHVKYDLFNNKKKTKPKKVDLRNEMGPKNFIEKSVCPEEISQVSADLPSYRSIQDGMVMIGCIREIQKMKLTVLLPGRISGKVMITQISSAYTRMLQKIANNELPPEYKQIKYIFKPGQCVATKIISFQSSDEKYFVNLSFCPHDINSGLSFNSVSVGMILWGAVSSVEEYGYVIDLGVKNCRAFLPKNNTDREYFCGQPLWCVVQKYEVVGVASTATVSALNENINSTKITKGVSLDFLLPGMQTDLTVNKILNNGLEVRFLDDYTGYIHESYLGNIFDKMNAYKIGQVLTGRIMYITPVTKLTFFTLRSLDFSGSFSIEEGTIVNCNVLNTTRGGLYVKLRKEHKGFVSFRRLKTRLSLDDDFDYNSEIKKNYPLGSSHQCRVLDYDCMENLYICTMEKDLLKEKLFSYKDLNVGDELTVEIREIQQNGLLIQAGRIEGYILNEHLTDTILTNYTNIKTKYHVGQKIKTRILNVNEETHTLHLTLKPSFLNSKQVLTCYNIAEHNQQYQGMVVQITKNGILVKFFGDVKGWVPRNQLSFEKVARPETMFKIGQVVNCTIIKCSPEAKKLTLSLQPPKHTSQRKKLHLGQHVNAKVTQILSTGLEVQSLDTKSNGIIPSQHLTHHPSLGELILKTYKEGDIINNLACINIGHGVPLLSIREKKYTETISDFNNLQTNEVIRCSVNNVNDKRLLLQSPIKDFDKLILVHSNNVCELPKKITQLDIKKNQCLLAKITKINKKNQIVNASTNLSDVWDGDLTVSLQLLSDYLTDIKRIHDHMITENNPLVKYKIGDTIPGIVKRINRSGTLVVHTQVGDTIVQGLIDSKHTIPDMKLNQEVQAIIMNVNYLKNSLELSINPLYMDKINPKQNGEINIKPGKHAFGTVVMVKKEFVLTTLRGNGNRQLTYLPTRLHYNDYVPNTDNYNIGDEIKMEIVKVENGFIIGISKELKKNFELAKKLVKRVRTNSETSDEEIKKKKHKKTKQQNNTVENDVADEEEESLGGSFVRIQSLKRTISDEDNQNCNSKQMQQVTEPKNKKKKQKKRKNSENEENKQESNSLIVDNDDVEHIEAFKKEINESNTNDDVSDTSEEETKAIDVDSKLNILKIEPLLSGMTNFWEAPTTHQVEEESSDNEQDEAEDLNKKQKKKKLTPAERAELARQEEEKLRKIELELADAEATPKTADQFDRLVLANPNSSMMWIKYMAFHLEATEIERARAVVRKALNAIEFREEQEKLNVWIAFLNLENRYGTKESFTNVLDEAVKMNDSLTVHLQALNILSESNKSSEFLELLNIISKKYKQEPKMWMGTAEACYKCEQKEQARNLMQRAVKSLEEKQHINVIVQFAFMESKWGEPERAEAILEKILASYPKRVDVWSSYVDMLIKAGRIQIARNVLERAIAQKLPPRKMKTLYSKFVQFETKYGEPENVKKIKQTADEYVKNILK